jgi:CBS domain containing-hemolysin-like protein
MDGDSWRWAVIVLLVLLNAFFVAAEYALVGARPTKIAHLARRGGRAAKAAHHALANLSPYIAGIQLAITMAGIALGAVGEHYIARKLEPLFTGIGLHFIASVIAFLFVTFTLVLLGELVPKYLIIRDADRATLRLILPLNVILAFIRPLTLILEFCGYWLLRPFGVNIREQRTQIVAKDEVAAIIRAGASAGEFGGQHAKMVTRTLRLADLQADDVMIPRVDIGCLDLNASRDELLAALGGQRHTRLVAVESGDLDEIAGILHLQDAIRVLAGNATIRDSLRPAKFIPPNLSLDKVIELMRESGTQMLIVRDEHGGTAGLLTLEDVVEEVFGELDDQIERAQPSIDRRSDGRIVMRGDVRTDELAEFLGLDENPLDRETVATIIVDVLTRTPMLGDTIETPLGRLRVDNMARNRITRVSLLPNQ